MLPPHATNPFLALLFLRDGICLSGSVTLVLALPHLPLLSPSEQVVIFSDRRFAQTIGQPIQFRHFCSQNWSSMPRGSRGRMRRFYAAGSFLSRHSWQRASETFGSWSSLSNVIHYYWSFHRGLYLHPEWCAISSLLRWSHTSFPSNSHYLTPSHPGCCFSSSPLWCGLPVYEKNSPSDWKICVRLVGLSRIFFILREPVPYMQLTEKTWEMSSQSR